MKKTNENAQAVEVKEAPKATAPKATKAPKAEEKKPETKAAIAAAPASPEPPTPTPTATKKPEEEKVEEQQPTIPQQRIIFRLSRSIQIELIPVWGTGLWSVIDEGITTVCLSEYSYSKMMRCIEHCDDYKNIIACLNDCMKTERFEKHTRHWVERTLIKELGGHRHTHHIRRFFI